MDRKNNIHENGEDSKLRSLAGNKMPYDVPEAYFEGLPGKILDRIHHTPEKHISLRTRFIQLSAAAAVLILVVLAAVQYLFNTGTEISTEVAYNIEDIYRYNLDNMAELEDAYLMNFVDDQNIVVSNQAGDETNDISDEAIMEYLLAENHIEYHIMNEY